MGGETYQEQKVLTIASARLRSDVRGFLVVVVLLLVRVVVVDDDLVVVVCLELEVVGQ